jgi:hypothetical protein
MDETTRFQLEGKWLRNQEVRFSTETVRATAKEYASAKIHLHEENIYVALIADEPKSVLAIKLNAVAAMNLSLNILKNVRPIFPDILPDIVIEHTPPKDGQH